MADFGRECAQAGCEAAATHVIIESHSLAMLFRSGAGLVCTRHASEFAGIGGIPVSLDELRVAAQGDEAA